MATQTPKTVLKSVKLLRAQGALSIFGAKPPKWERVAPPGVFTADLVALFDWGGRVVEISNVHHHAAARRRLLNIEVPASGIWHREVHIYSDGARTPKVLPVYNDLEPAKS